MTNYTYGGITSGVACVGTITISGNANYMGAAYTYTGSSSTYGHTELGQVSGSCGPGTADANESPEVTLTNDEVGGVIWGPRNYSADWSSTWWRDNGGGSFSDFGSVCADY